MAYAIIKSGGKQYKIKEGDVIEIDKILNQSESIITFEDVLLLASDEKVDVGTPSLRNVKVRGKILDNVKGDKLSVSRFKAKVRYQKTIGFRSKLTRVKIEKIEISSGKDNAVKSKSKKT